MGAEEAELNKAFGRHMAQCVDIAIVIGKGHADPCLLYTSANETLARQNHSLYIRY